MGSEEELLEGLDESLKQQVNEIDPPEAADEGSSILENSEDGIKDNEDQIKDNGGRKKKNQLKILLIVLGVIVVLLVGLLGTRSGRNMVYSVVATYIRGKTKAPEVTPGLVETTDTGETEVTPALLVDDEEEENVKNYLLFGIEEIEGGGRTDVMMIASINKRDKTIRLTSLLRDLYLEIPGHGQDRLNAAYGYGGADLLVSTIEQNFSLPLEGYAHVNFSAFENVIDLLGGIEIELGKTEANYLNTTNYISNVSERHVTAGVNLLTGNQALGYCRVRKVATLGGENNDFGRTLRHRRVMTAIFEKYKEKNPIELLSIMNECLGYVTTDLSAEQITEIMDSVIEDQIFTLENDHIPQANMYSDYYTPRGEAVLLPDLAANTEFLHDLIYNEPETALAVDNQSEEFDTLSEQ